MIGIYMISSISKPERQYIGSAKNIDKRIKEHFYALNKGYHHAKKMQRHFNKYGQSGLICEVLEKVPSIPLLITAEQSFLNMFTPYFNSSPSAGTNRGCKLPPLSDAHRAIISKTFKGKKRPLEEVAKGHVKMHKYTIDGELVRTYKSGVEAAIMEGIRVRQSRGSNVTIGGYVWVSDSQKLPDFAKLKEQLKNKHSYLRKQVQQFDKKGNLIAEFEGVRIACKETGIDHRSIAQVAGGSKIRKTAGGFVWRYKGGLEDVT